MLKKKMHACTLLNKLSTCTLLNKLSTCDNAQLKHSAHITVRKILYKAHTTFTALYHCYIRNQGFSIIASYSNEE